eukprot:scaffold306_cov525-Prasinococcus_capsulatus_cf.AAC.70
MDWSTTAALQAPTRQQQSHTPCAPQYETRTHRDEACVSKTVEMLVVPGVVRPTAVCLSVGCQIVDGCPLRLPRNGRTACVCPILFRPLASRGGFRRLRFSTKATGGLVFASSHRCTNSPAPPAEHVAGRRHLTPVVPKGAGARLWPVSWGAAYRCAAVRYPAVG